MNSNIISDSFMYYKQHKEYNQSSLGNVALKFNDIAAYNKGMLSHKAPHKCTPLIMHIAMQKDLFFNKMPRNGDKLLL